MNDLKGTKKEWYIGEYRQNGIQIGCNQSHYVACAYRGGSDRTDDEVIANAQLIAAAPEMLETLIKIAKLRRIGNEYSLLEIESIIAKALGKGGSHE